MPERYRTIVADPPWEYPGGFGTVPDRPFPGKRAAGSDTTGTFVKRPIPYETLTVDQIAALPVETMADDAAHLYLWTTQRYLWSAPRIAAAWGFKPSCTLVWCKPPAGVHGGTFVANVEFVLFCRRGKLAAQERVYGQWFQWKRAAHSQKPDGFLDLVEQVSPGPYLELFARRARFGWDYWGNQSLGTAELRAPG
jgi:N6-adenosine-specific RNA methylase IME4